MNELRFQQNFHFTILKTVYENPNTGSSFYEAFDNVERRKVGIKRIERINQAQLSAVRTEAVTLHKMSELTAYIPALYSTYYDASQKVYYLILQFIEGDSLRQMMTRNLHPSAALDLVVKLCDILIPLHNSRYQHRDIKPENIIVKGAKVFLIDFNLTALVPTKGEGTDGYAAPEQNRGFRGVGTERVDIFSLGVVLYEILTSQRPILGVDYYASRPDSKEWDMYAAPHEKTAGVPATLSEIVARCMKLNPAERYQNAFELKRELLRAKRGAANHGT